MPDVRQLLVDPRGQALGIGQVQEAVRQSVEVLQHAFQRPVQPALAPTLLDPLLRPGDHGGHVGPGLSVLPGHGLADPGVPGGQGIGGLPGHGLAAGTPLRSGEQERMGMSTSSCLGALWSYPSWTLGNGESILEYQHSTGCKR